MKNNRISVTGTGDSLFTAPFPEEYKKTNAPIRDFIQGCDVRITNLETNLSDFESFGSAYSGGTWLNTPTAYAKDLFSLGFQYFGTANNHVMDYSYGGMLSTIDFLNRSGKAHSGTGKSLEEASAPALFEANGQKIAVFAVDSSFENPSRAGRATHFVKPRPGVNYLRHDTTYTITKEEEECLRKIAAKTGINTGREGSIKTGFLTPDPEGYFMFGNQKYTTLPDVPRTKCNEKDLKRILDDVRKAKKENDHVFLLIHCHDDDNYCHENPPAYLVDFAHQCIDAGCSAIFGGGCHSLRGIELYKGLPIFYSLGDFIYQGLTVEHLPADFMEKYDVDIYADTKEAFRVRSRDWTVGLSWHLKNFQTVLPRLEYEGDKLVSFALMPVQLVFERKDEMNGLPMKAEGKEAEAIFQILKNLSSNFGTSLKLENGMILLDR